MEEQNPRPNRIQTFKFPDIKNRYQETREISIDLEKIESVHVQLNNQIYVLKIQLSTLMVTVDFDNRMDKAIEGRDSVIERWRKYYGE